MRERRAMLRRTTHGPERCQWPQGCASEACDPHELLSRARGGSIVDPGNIALLCRAHHDWVTTHPSEAAELGLALSRPVNDPSTSLVRSAIVNAMPERKPIALRVSPHADEWVQAQSERHGVSRSVVLRAMLSVATQHREEVDDKIKAMREVE